MDDPLLPICPATLPPQPPPPCWNDPSAPTVLRAVAVVFSVILVIKIMLVTKNNEHNENYINTDTPIQYHLVISYRKRLSSGMQCTAMQFHDQFIRFSLLGLLYLLEHLSLFSKPILGSLIPSTCSKKEATR